MAARVVAIASLIAGASALRAPIPASRSRVEAPRTTLDRRAVVAVVASMFAAAPALAEYTVPDLPYPYEALEPHIDAATMRFHHDKHHAAYVANVNKALAGKPEVSILELQKDAIAAGPAVRNNGGGHYNHAMFWQELGPATGKGPTGELAKKIDEAFGSFDKFKEEFSAKSAGRFGSGWCWLGVKPDGKLAIDTTPNQDNPLMDGGCETKMIPILGLDVWEHAYYLKYQNRRPEYISAFFNVVNWDKVASNYEKYAKQGKGIPF